MRRRPNLVDLTLYLVTDHRQPFPEMLRTVLAAVSGGVTLVQLRNPIAGGRELVEQAVALKSALARRARLIVNDRVDVARAADADGAHVGQSDLPIEAARAILGEAAILGLSITDHGQLAAVPPATDYLGVGPVFATGTKSNAAPELGLTETASIVSKTTLPCVAIGGIDVTNAAAVMATGVGGISVVSAISNATDPEQAARSLRAALGH